MKITVREMAEAAMLVALAIILDLPFLKFKIGASGGSISFTMVPLFVLALRTKPWKSFLYIAIVYSLLSVVIDGEPFYSLPFDYCLAYGAIAIIGFSRKRIITEKITFLGVLFLVEGVIACCVLRILSSTISSMIFYETGFWAGVLYNLAYIGPSAGITLAAMLILYQPLLTIEKHYPSKSI